MTIPAFATHRPCNRRPRHAAVRAEVSGGGIDRHWREGFKDRVTDRGKASRRGRLTLAQHCGHRSFRSGALADAAVEVPAPQWAKAGMLHCPAWQHREFACDGRSPPYARKAEAAG